MDEPRREAQPQTARQRYLAEHDVLCFACGYNLRGLRGDRCPECATLIPEPGVDPIPMTLREFLHERDLYCRHCKHTLRDLEGNTCPGCGAVYYLAGGTRRAARRPDPFEPDQFAAGCLGLMGLAGAAIVLFRVALAMMGGLQGLRSGWATLGLPLILVPLAMFAALAFGRTSLQTLTRWERWAISVAMVAVGALAAAWGVAMVW